MVAWEALDRGKVATDETLAVRLNGDGNNIGIDVEIKCPVDPAIDLHPGQKIARLATKTVGSVKIAAE